jgi:RHS repeat-associated protein
VLHQDVVGSVVKVTDGTGAVVSRYRYEAFGAHEAVGTEGYASPILWQGREYDAETGLYYFRARYYAAELGRFVSQDPISVTRGSNLYVHGENDPVNTVDPSGLECWRIDEDTVKCESETGNTWQCTGDGVTIDQCKKYLESRGVQVCEGMCREERLALVGGLYGLASAVGGGALLIAGAATFAAASRFPGGSKLAKPVGSVMLGLGVRLFGSGSAAVVNAGEALVPHVAGHRDKEPVREYDLSRR